MEELNRLSRTTEWTSLLALFRALEATATEALIGFSDANNAYERRGFILGMRRGLEAVEEIYATTHGVNNGSLNRTPERRAGIADALARIGGSISEPDPINPADRPADGPSY